MDSKDLRKLQNTQKDILKEVIRVCKQNDILYFVAYGTLLGTIRHKGSIPWDNDIDIMMTRKEFNKFLAVKDKLPSHLVVKFLDTDDVETVGEVRVSNTRTLQYGINHQEKKGNVSIDIFIMDYAKIMPSWMVSIKSKYVKLLHFLSLDEFERKWLYDIQKGSKLKMLFLKATEIAGKGYSSDKAIKKIKKMLTCEKSPYYICISDLTEYILFEASGFEKPVEMPYEDIMVNVPQTYDKVLTASYGDYMQLPPEEKRFTSQLDDFVVEYLDE